MNRDHTVLSFFIPLVAIVLGLTAYLLLGIFVSLPGLNIFQIIGVGLVLGISEVLMLRRLPQKAFEYLLLDGILFPYISVGVSVGMIFGSN